MSFTAVFEMQVKVTCGRNHTSMVYISMNCNKYIYLCYHQPKYKQTYRIYQCPWTFIFPGTPHPQHTHTPPSISIVITVMVALEMVIKV